MPDKRKCRFYKKMRKKGYSYCLRNNTKRRMNCPCKYYNPKFIYKIKLWYEKVSDLWW